MLAALVASALALAAPSPPKAPFAPEVCASSAHGACVAARAFVDRMSGRRCLVAFKAARLLYLFEGGTPVDRQVDLKDYDPNVKGRALARIRFPTPIALSSAAAGRKERTGDRRTPEGEYTICQAIAASEYTYFLSLSYPAQRDVDAAVREKRFDARALERVRRSQQPGACPDFGSELGGAIGIHGAPTGMARELAAAEALDPDLRIVTTRDWTLGCIAVENRYIRFLAREVPLGTPILVVP